MKPDKKEAKKLKLRNPASQKRNNRILVRVSDFEKRKIRAMFGRRTAAMARMLLLGIDTPKPAALESTAKLELMHALYAHFVAMQPLRNRFAREGDENDKVILDKEIEEFNKLIRICFSNF